MNSLLSTVRALAIGAATMYYLDPNRGRARRARLADQLRRLARDAEYQLRAVSKRAADRSRGVAAGFAPRSAEPIDDAQLEARVRARLGRLVRHPGAIETEVSGGRLRLRGPVLKRELNRLMAGLWHVHGLNGIDNQLSVRERPDGEPALQGEANRGPRPGQWSRPLLLALGGGALACASLHRGALFRAGAYATSATLLLNAWLAPPTVPGSRAARRRAAQRRAAQQAQPPLAQAMAAPPRPRSAAAQETGAAR